MLLTLLMMLRCMLHLLLLFKMVVEVTRVMLRSQELLQLLMLQIVMQLIRLLCFLLNPRVFHHLLMLVVVEARLLHSLTAVLLLLLLTERHPVVLLVDVGEAWLPVLDTAVVVVAAAGVAILEDLLLNRVLICERQVVIQLPLKTFIHVHHLLHAQGVGVLRHLMHRVTTVVTTAAGEAVMMVIAAAAASITVSVSFHETLGMDVTVAFLRRRLTHEVILRSRYNRNGAVSLVIRIAIHKMVPTISDVNQTRFLFIVLKVVEQLEEHLHSDQGI